MSLTQKVFSSNIPPSLHVLLSAAPCESDLLMVSSKKLILHYENMFSPYETLKGFRGDYYWKDGSIRFSLNSPDLPELGLVASLFCKFVPFVYFSIDGGVKSAPRYFMGGEQKRIESIPAELREKFLQMSSTGQGIVRPIAALPAALWN